MLKRGQGLYTQTLGQGADLVLIHGWGMHSAVWEDFATRLARHFRVTLVDLPGHGRSGYQAPFSLEKLSDVLLDALPHPAHWLGWSMGALIALHLAYCHPTRVQRLVLIAGGPRFLADEDWPGMEPALLQRFADDFASDYAASLKRFLLLQNLGQDQANVFHKQLAERLLGYPSPEPAALQGGLALLKHTDLRHCLAELQQPVLQILGARDRLASRHLGEAMQRLSSRCAVHVLETAGHMPFLTHPDEVLALIRDFL